MRDTGGTGRKHALAWTLVAGTLILLALSGHIDALGQTYAQEILTRALVTFAIARALNGAISTAQGTELSLEPGGVGVNFSVGEMLDPINDLVERFSVVMLVATSSLGIQNVFMRITAWWGVSAVLTGLAILLLAQLWLRGPQWLDIARLKRWLVLAALVRFAFPMLMMTTTVVFDTFLADDHAAATIALETASEDIEDLNAQNEESADEDGSILSQLGSLVSSLDARQRIEALRNRIANAAENIIDLVVIFVFQTIVMPLLFLWIAAELAKAVIARTTKL